MRVQLPAALVGAKGVKTAELESVRITDTVPRQLYGTVALRLGSLGVLLGRSKGLMKRSTSADGCRRWRGRRGRRRTS